MAEKADIVKSTKTDSSSFDKKEAEAGKAMAILSYIGILCLIPFLAEKKNKFVRLHAVAGLNLFIIEIIWTVAISILTSIMAPSAVYGILSGNGAGLGGMFLVGTISWLGSIALLVLSIIGIVNAAQNKYKDLPVVGGLKFVKK